MKNAGKYGLMIGVASGAWILLMHLAGACEREYPRTGALAVLEYAFILVPLIAMYVGIRDFRDNFNGGRMQLWEGLFEGAKIIFIGSIIALAFFAVYSQVCSQARATDFMARIFGIASLALLFDLAISLILMNGEREL